MTDRVSYAQREAPSGPWAERCTSDSDSELRSKLIPPVQACRYLPQVVHTGRLRATFDSSR